MKKLSLVLVVLFFVSIATYGAGWSDDGTVVRLTTSTDKVGIGTSSPAQKLHVNGNIYLPYNNRVIFGGASIMGYYSGYGGLRIYGNGGGYNNLGITVDPSGKIGIMKSSASYPLDVNGTIAMTGFKLTTGPQVDGYVLTSNSSGVGTWQEAPSGGGGTSYWDDNANGIHYEDGNVGIGTDNPFEKLHVEGKVRIGGLNGTTNYGLIINPSEGPDGYDVLFECTPPGTKAIKFEVWDDVMMRIYNEGNPNTDRVTFPTGSVGIGTNDPQSKLDVSGTITADEIEVQSDGLPDFVFEDNYKLMSLSKLEKHIRKEKSLPGIPTNKEAIEKGVKVGDMQAKLLQKVEELTLYVIEQDREIAELKERIAELEK